MEFRITIVSSERPEQDNLNDELLWLGGSLGLFGLRDKDKSCFRVFLELIKNARSGKQCSSDEIAANLGLSRGTVVHHINKLMDSGIVVVSNNRYYLKMNSLERLVEEVRRDVDRQLGILKEIAIDIDRKLELE